MKVTADGRFVILPDGKMMRRYAPDGKVLRAFLSDRASRVKVIQGPQGSGTSTACCQHIYQQAMSQPPQADGVRRFRAHVFRETYPKIEETCLRTWLDWFTPKEYGRFYETRPYIHEVRVPGLALDVIFMAMDDIRDAKSYFDSLETSLIWFNEGQHAQLAVIRYAIGRVSPPRYPAVKDGGCAWGGLIIDTNAPPADHWIPIMRGDVPPPDWMSDDERQALRKPDNWEFYLQPPGLIEEFDERGTFLGYRPNPEAENLRNLHQPDVDPLGPKNFYMEKIGGQTKDWIDAYIMNRSAVVIDGKPVYPKFRRSLNVAVENLRPIEGHPVFVGLDFGRSPAAIFSQVLQGRWFVQRELIGRDIGANDFAPLVKSELTTHYPGSPVAIYGDPSGGYRGQTGDTTPFDVFRAHGLRVLPSPDYHRYSLRWEAVGSLLMRDPEDRPRLTVDPRLTTFITGMAGGYYLRRKQVKMMIGDSHDEEPVKNQYSHVCEAFEASVLGGGEGRSLILPGQARPKPQQVRRPYNPFKKVGGVRGW